MFFEVGWNDGGGVGLNLSIFNFLRKVSLVSSCLLVFDCP